MPLKLLLSAGLMAIAAPVMAAPAQPTFDRAAWLSDYARLKVALAQSYANLDWQVNWRGINLARADAQISAMLQGAKDDTAATLIMVQLIDAFDDPHLKLKAGTPPAGSTLVPQSSDNRGPTQLPSDCDVEGYREGRAATQLPYSTAPGWTEIAAAPFHSGLIGDVGIIRIPSFDETRYLAACKAATKPGLKGRELQLATRAELNRRLAKLVAELRKKGMKRLVIDLSRNGGGSEWSSEAITLFAAGRLSRIEPRRAGPSCDRSAIWKGEKPACEPYAGPATTEWIEASPDENAWSGPLAILADKDTASAAEEFITWARDNGKALMGGERTFGAGCGYMDGGAAFQFTAVPMHLMMPNCSRFTRDGVNEIEGQKPDLSIDWPTLKPEQVPVTLEALFALTPR